MPRFLNLNIRKFGFAIQREWEWNIRFRQHPAAAGHGLSSYIRNKPENEKLQNKPLAVWAAALQSQCFRISPVRAASVFSQFSVFYQLWTAIPFSVLIYHFFHRSERILHFMKNTLATWIIQFHHDLTKLRPFENHLFQNGPKNWLLKIGHILAKS